MQPLDIGTEERIISYTYKLVQKIIYYIQIEIVYQNSYNNLQNWLFALMLWEILGSWLISMIRSTQKKCIQNKSEFPLW